MNRKNVAKQKTAGISGKRANPNPKISIVSIEIIWNGLAASERKFQNLSQLKGRRFGLSDLIW